MTETVLVLRTCTPEMQCCSAHQGHEPFTWPSSCDEPGCVTFTGGGT